MEIKINGRAADVKFENEKTIGQVMAALENWLANSGHRLSGFSIDEQSVDLSSLEEAFNREIDNVKILSIETTSVAQLSAMSLHNLLHDIKEYENISYEDRNIFYNNWKERPQSLFIQEQHPDLLDAFVNTFINGALGTDILRSITEERLREAETPLIEAEKLKPLLEETCSRLIDLPLDIQTGKDSRATQTIQIFTGITEKIFRIYRQLDIQGYLTQSLKENSVSQLIYEFNSYARDLLHAYETNDTVLIGDLCEYEMAPRLQGIYDAIIKDTK